LIRGTEACDDGDLDALDGCSDTCTEETGWDCINEPSVCTPICPDGLLKGSETCDDNNSDTTDGCSSC